MNNKHYRRMLEDSLNEDLDKAIKSPSKHIPLARLKQIKQDNAIGAAGQEYSEEELNDEIMSRKMSDAERMVREADRAQAYRGLKLKMAKDEGVHDTSSVVASAERANNNIDTAGTIFSRLYGKNPNQKFKLTTLPLSSVYSHRKYPDGDKFEHPHEPLYIEGNKEDESWAQKFSKQYPSGQTAEPIIAHPDSKGKHFIVDGRHRARAAHLRGETHIKAFVPVDSNLTKSLKPKTTQSLDEQLNDLQTRKESLTDKMAALDRDHPDRVKLRDEWHSLNDKRDGLVNSKHISNIDQKALGGLRDTHDTENVMFHGSLNTKLSGFKSHDQNPKSSNYGQKKGVGVSFSPNASYSEQYTTKYGLGEGKQGQVYKVIPTKGSILDVHKNPNVIREAAEKLGVAQHLNRAFNSQPNIQLEHAIGKKYPELDKQGIYKLMSQNGIKGFSVGGDYGKEYIVHDPSDFAVFSQDGKLVSKHKSMKKSYKIPGGLADGKKPSDFPKLKINQGKKVEMEHTSDGKIAEEIAMDHLTEDPKYYEKLKTIEKSELQKMSRPRLTFPGLPKVSTRPDQDVQVMETGRQKDLYGRKVANAVVNEYAASKPGTVKDKKPYMDIAAKRTAGKFDRNTLGVNQSTKDKSYSAALGGKLRSKFEEGDEVYDQKMEAHKQKVTDTRNKYFEDIAEWKKQSESLPKGSNAYWEHIANRPKYTKPRKPSKSLKATKDLSPDQMKQRGNAVESTVEHEGFHSIMDQVEREYGGRAAHIVKEKILSSHDPEALKHVASYISNKLGYKPRSEHFEEEVLAHARDILVNPKKRASFKAHIGSNNADEIIKKLKAGHQKAYDFSQGVTPESLEQEDMKQFPVPTKLAASEMEKGVARRLYGKFDPNKLDGRDAVNEWQTSAPALQDTYPDYSDEEHQDARERIPEMDPALKLRSLNKLSNRTLTRRHPETGKRQFLLFRGVGADEKESSIGDRFVQHDSHSSWTPHLKVARGFENDYHSDDTNPAKTIAAWVNEDKIHSAPHMYGNMPEIKPDMDNAGNFYTPGKNIPGQNTYALEHEVVVAPHVSDRATHGDVKRYSALHGAGSKTIKESDPKKDLHARINYRADYEYSHGPSSKNYPIIRTTKPLDVKQNKKPKKLVASEPLNKAPLEYTSGIISEMPPKEPWNGNFSKITEKQLPNGLIYKQYAKDNSHLHQIFHPEHEAPVSEVTTRGVGNPDPSAVQDHKVTWSQVHPEHKGNGYGKIAYKAALLHGKGIGRLVSDQLTSRQAEKAWDHLQQQPGVKVKRGKWLPSSPVYTKEQDEAIDSQHSAVIPVKSAIDEKAMFPKLDQPKKLAASEKNE